MRLLSDAGYRLNNVDTTIVAQVPKLAPHTDAMKQLLADDLGVDPSQVNIKATTTERLGFEGREEGISVHAIALIEQC
jgi:2-C-methyl-D-erythritol 2,4-cyclodiphosphate synthase